MAAPKANIPWSVKGIDRDARESAKKAAQREGMTVGAWLNQIIYKAADPRISGGLVDGLELQDVVRAIEALNQRIATEENKSAEAINGLSRTYSGMAQRLQQVEAAGGIGENGETLAVDPALEQRIARLEEKTNDRDRVKALKALERAVSQVALQFESTREQAFGRLDQQEKELSALVAQFSTGENIGGGNTMEELRSTVSALTERLARAEKITAQAAQLREQAKDVSNPEFVQQTGQKLRALGDEIKRNGDHIRGLEKTIIKLATQIDAAERRSAEGVEKVSETISTIRSQFLQGDEENAAPRADLEAAIEEVALQTEQRIEALQDSFEEMIARLSGEQSAPSARTTSATRSQDPESDALNAIVQQIVSTNPTAPAPDAASQDDTDTDSAHLNLQVLSENGAENEDTGDVSFEDADPQGSIGDNALPAEYETGGEASESALDQEEPLTLDSADETAAAEQEDDERAYGTDDILSEVRRALAPEPESAAPLEEADDVAAPPSTSNDLDAVLAELESMGFRDDGFSDDEEDDDETTVSSASDTAFDNAQETSDPFEADLDSAADAPDLHADASMDEPVTAAAPEIGEDETSELDAANAMALEHPLGDKTGRPLTKRQLSPKQRAILAARFKRKKQRAEEQADAESARDDAKVMAERALPASSISAAIDVDIDEPADTDATPETTADAPQSSSLVSRVLDSIKNRQQQRGDQNDEPEDTTVENAEADQEDPTAPSSAETAAPQDAAIENLKAEITDDPLDGFDDDAFDLDEEEDNTQERRSGLSARPVTVALGVSILLAVIALGFIVTDIISTPFNRQSPAPFTTNDGPSAASTPSPTANGAQQPRDIYLQAVAALQSAGTSMEEENAVLRLKESAALGHPPAQLQLGEMYKTGQGVSQNLEEARLWFERAGEGGNILAMHRAGVMAAQGEGGPADLGKAINWFEQAANRGLVDAQYNLGALYHPDAEGAAAGYQDTGKAYFWYALAASNGDDQAQSLSSGLAVAISADQKAELDKQVAGWSKIPANAQANEVASAS